MNGTLLVKNNQHETVVRHLGVRGRLSRKLSLPSDVTLTEGTKVIIQLLRPAENGDSIFNLTVYGDITDGAVSPEVGVDMAPRNNHIVQVNPLQYFTFDERMTPSHEPLFPNHDSPSIDEVIQGDIPNCAFLSGVQAILSHPDGAAFIRGMMKRNADGTVSSGPQK
jgi:hypothetical protein